MATIIDLTQVRAARARRTGAAADGEPADTRAVVIERLQRSLRSLQAAHDRLAAIQEMCTAARAFQRACRDAWELDDLDEMIRRRDALARDLAVVEPEGDRP